MDEFTRQLYMDHYSWSDYSTAKITIARHCLNLKIALSIHILVLSLAYSYASFISSMEANTRVSASSTKTPSVH